MDPKLTMLFLLIGTIIGLSQLGDENLTKMKRYLDGLRWRNLRLSSWPFGPAPSASGFGSARHGLPLIKRKWR